MTFLKRAGLVIAALLSAFGLYALVTVLNAQAETPERVRAAFAKSAVRVEPGQLPKRWISALITVDDPHFYAHGGTDFSSGIMTTIPQALTKQLYFEHFEPGLAKIRQSLIARFALDATMPKDALLSLFLTRAYLGEGPTGPVHGFAEGAKAYYGKPLAALTDDEFLGLVAMLPAPNLFHPLKAPEIHAHQLARVRKLAAGGCHREGLMDGYYRACD